MQVRYGYGNNGSYNCPGSSNALPRVNRTDASNLAFSQSATDNTMTSTKMTRS
uniref:Uncharacterized protein n=1 Tax=Picea glauca TaxID=3330 RepID=A0A101M2B7_PICGL|nr:hypothetical protein ABT39_MTgene2978 [Picea glauca]